jgi:hypothetical protein
LCGRLEPLGVGLAVGDSAQFGGVLGIAADQREQALELVAHRRVGLCSAAKFFGGQARWVKASAGRVGDVDRKWGEVILTIPRAAHDLEVVVAQLLELATGLGGLGEALRVGWVLGPDLAIEDRIEQARGGDQLVEGGALGLG